MLLACIITVVVETFLFFICGYRDKDEIVVVALANVVTNLSLNLFLGLVPAAFAFPWIILLEILVCAAEYLIYKAASMQSKRLLLLTIAANAITYTLGLVLNHFALL